MRRVEQFEGFDVRGDLLKKVGKDQHLKRIDLFHSLIVGQKQSGFRLNSRGELQSIGQADRVARPNERRGFRQFLVNRRYGQGRERLKREFDFVGERKVLSAKGLVRISANVTVEVTARRTLFSSRVNTGSRRSA